MQLDLQVASAEATIVGRSASRARGAYYTPADAAHAMVAWAVRHSDDVVLEPSFGDGVFLSALADLAMAQGWSPSVHGAEIEPETFSRTTANPRTSPGRAYCKDFLALQPFPVNVIIGNPPYVRLRHMPKANAERALTIAASRLGQPMEPAGSVWMPFLLHGLQFLQPNGRLAFVLPHEATYVRYARPLWPVLAANFGALRVVRVKERLFPSILQGVVLLLADEFGRSTSTVRFDAFDTVDDFLADRNASTSSIAISAIASGTRPFVEALLPAELRLMLPALRDQSEPASAHVRFHIGYVAGDKRYFHPSPATVQTFRLPSRSLRPALTSARRIARRGLLTSEIPKEAVSDLFLPHTSATLSDGEEEYVAHGEREGVSRRYKCRVRRPWYVVPDVRVPDVLIPTFTERPLLLVNDDGFVASNSFLCGYLCSEASALEVAAAWYTSLTLLESEMRVHALGGGVLVFVPREAARIRIARPQGEAGTAHLESVSASIRRGRVDEAFEKGDAAILAGRLGLSRNQVRLIQEGVDRLRSWRTSSLATATG